MSSAADRVDAAVAALLNQHAVNNGAAAEMAKDHLRLLVDAFQGPFCEVLSLKALTI